MSDQLAPHKAIRSDKVLSISFWSSSSSNTDSGCLLVCRLYQLNKCQLDFLQLNQSHPILNYVISLMSISQTHGQFPICLWNHFRGERPRTNNVFELILVLRKEQIHTETMIMQKEGELQPVKKQKRDVSINGRLYDDHGPQKKQNH